jgi:hypothetical protein
VAEEQPIGSIVGKISATDPDSPIDRYEFLPPHPFFSIDGRSGLMLFSFIYKSQPLILY